MTDDGPILAIGAVLGDSDRESLEWSRAIGQLSITTEQLGADLRSQVRVNVVFHVDGRIAPNEFKGVRTGRYNKAKRVLVVQVTVAKTATPDRRALLVALLGEAIHTAEAYVQGKKLADELPELRILVSQLQTASP